MGKSFQDRIKELEEYNPDITYKDGAFILKIKFKEHWQIIEADGKEVACSQDDKDHTLYWYCSNIENSDKLLDLIDETISVNKEYEKKTTLYKKKVKELQELFLSDISYEKLKLVKFIIDDKETKPKAKKSPSKAQKNKQSKPSSIEQPKLDKSPNGMSETVSNDENYTGDIDNAIEKALGENNL
jgi:hypothetical protein